MWGVGTLWSGIGSQVLVRHRRDQIKRQPANVTLAKRIEVSESEEDRRKYESTSWLTSPNSTICENGPKLPLVLTQSE